MILNWLKQILSAQKTSDLETVLLGAMSHYGFQNVFYTARFLLSLPSSLARGHAVTVSNLRPEIARQVSHAGDLRQAFWAEWVYRNDGDISSRQLLKEFAGRPPSEMLQAARQFDLEAVQIISLRDRVLRSHGALILSPHFGASHDDVAEVWAQCGREVRTLAWVFHMRMATIRRDAGTLLTPRQREVLEWRSAGKTVSEIATIIGVTPATVEKHMRLAREALDAETTAQAILKAHVAQELFPDDGTQNPFA